MADAIDILRREIAEHRDVLDEFERDLTHWIDQAVGELHRCIAAGGKILLFGNGGSAADAQHLAAELVIRYRRDRAPIGAVALTTDSSVLTAAANELGYESVFSRQIEALGRQGDAALGLSTSGRSRNVLAGLEVARRRGLRTIGLCGQDPGGMSGLCDVLLAVPSSTTARIQEMHCLIGHLLCAGLDDRQSESAQG